jgi:hypothetical protein
MIPKGIGIVEIAIVQHRCFVEGNSFHTFPCQTRPPLTLSNTTNLHRPSQKPQ